MHQPPAFVQTDPARIMALIAANPFATLVTHGPDGLAASHVPFVMDYNNDAAAPFPTGLTLTGHLAAANAQGAAIAGGAALAIFTGPHAQISPAWYATGPSVPTWDYTAVHVHGTLEEVAGEELAALMARISATDPGGFALEALPDAFRTRMFAGLRGFRLRTARIEAQWKLSQNRSVADRQGVVTALRRRGEQEVADLVAATLPAES